MIEIERHGDEPLYTQIYRSIKTDIRTGLLRPGDRLVPIRQQAQLLNVSRNTVEAAYLQLVTEGYVRGRVGSGYVVDDVDFSELAELGGYQSPEERVKANQVPDFASDPYSDLPPCDFDFTYGNQPHDSFPARKWKSLMSEALTSVDNRSSQYSDGLGEPALRREIARHVKAASGTVCQPEQVVIMPGTQAALTAICMLFDPATDAVAFENPGYDGARDVFKNLRFQLKPLSAFTGGQLDNNNEFIEALHNSNAKLAFVTPSNQFPTGATMQILTRIRMLRWATDSDAYIIEDDYCREFRYRSQPIPSLQSLDRGNRVIYMGTMSKVLSPALRISYIVLPPKLLERWRNTFRSYYCAVPWLSQETLRLFMERGYWDSHTRSIVAARKAVNEVVMHCLNREMGDRVTIIGGEAGLHLLVSVNDDRSQEELIAAAAEQGVRVYPTKRYWDGEPLSYPNAVLLGYSSIGREAVPEGIARLRKAWFG